MKTHHSVISALTSDLALYKEAKIMNVLGNLDTDTDISVVIRISAACSVSTMMSIVLLLANHGLVKTYHDNLTSIASRAAIDNGWVDLIVQCQQDDEY